MRLLESLRKQFRKNPLMVVGIFIIIIWIFISFFPSLIAPYNPLSQVLRDRLSPPSLSHLCGVDQLGRDVLSRVLYGGRISLPTGITVIVTATLIGTAVGGLAGYSGGMLDEILMRMTEVFMAFPSIILAMAIAAALGPNLMNAVIAMVIVWWPRSARTIRSLVISVKSNEYIQAAHAIGSSHCRILLRTVLPNCLGPAVVMATIDIGNAILVFAGLSYLGLGGDPSAPEWGRMVSNGIAYFDQWWISMFPGLAIFIVIMAFNFIGDGLRDMMDPRTRRLV